MKRADIKRRPLADTVLTALEPESVEYREPDGQGLYFRVKPDGNKSWQLRYKNAAGKWPFHGLGGYPAISGTKARELAAVARKEISNGIYPADKKAAKKAAIATANTKTFLIVAEQWFEFKQSKGLAESSLRKIRTYLDKDILPALGDKLLDDITREDCRKLQQSLEARDAHNVAEKCRSWLNQIFGWAIGCGLTDNDPASRLADIAAAAPPTKQFPHLLEPELPEFLQALRACTSRTPAKTAVWLCLWTASRPGNIREAEWAEFDLDAALWTIPGPKMKVRGRSAHVVPLPRQAVEALRSLRCITGRSRWVFPGNGAVNPFMSENTINTVIANAGFKGRLVGHGSRHTARTLLAEHEWSEDFRKEQTAHAKPGMEGVYDKAQYLPQRRVMMQWYADYLDCLADGMTPAQRANFDSRVNVVEAMK
ncbi:MAG: integrase [Deltaproteobacteria bacterium RIFCSPLOWO2_02_FULL_53_8]|nr:MAG: integrase [Deltaproteobacteria bacterium RIFCSPLOWO2_02_FULL_53_8]